MNEKAKTILRTLAAMLMFAIIFAYILSAIFN